MFGCQCYSAVWSRPSAKDKLNRTENDEEWRLNLNMVRYEISVSTIQKEVSPSTVLISFGRKNRCPSPPPPPGSRWNNRGPPVGGGGGAEFWMSAWVICISFMKKQFVATSRYTILEETGKTWQQVMLLWKRKERQFSFRTQHLDRRCVCDPTV